jgi:hypothetical protein
MLDQKSFFGLCLLRPLEPPPPQLTPDVYDLLSSKSTTFLGYLSCHPSGGSKYSLGINWLPKPVSPASADASGLFVKEHLCLREDFLRWSGAIKFGVGLGIGYAISEFFLSKTTSVNKLLFIRK